jgi:hypothetical protein
VVGVEAAAMLPHGRKLLLLPYLYLLLTQHFPGQRCRSRSSAKATAQGHGHMRRHSPPLAMDVWSSGCGRAPPLLVPWSQERAGGGQAPRI